MDNERNNKRGQMDEDYFVRRQTGRAQNDSPMPEANRSPKPQKELKWQPAAAMKGEKIKALSGAFGKKAEKLRELIKDLLFGRDKDRHYREYKMSLAVRNLSIAAFSVVALTALIICTSLAYSYSGDSIRLMSLMTESERSDAKNYRIIYSEQDPWGLAAATALRDQFFEKTGASLPIFSDDTGVSKHEIRVGYTNRAGDDYITSLAVLGNDGYAIILSSGDNVDITAFTEAGALAAVKYFVNSYVGAYRAGEMIFASRINSSFVSRSGVEPDRAIRETKIPLSFTETGKFKALILSDADINTNTISAIGAISDSEKPQLVIFAGDASSLVNTKAELEAYVKALSAPLEEREIPWAVIFGEQDTDGGLSAELQMEVYTSFEHCVAKTDLSSDGTVSYYLPIFAYNEGDAHSAPVFGIWAMGQTPMLSLTDSGAASDPLLSEHRENGRDYGYVNSDQIAWFLRNSALMDREAGGMMPSVIVTHTPVPEFKIVVDNPEATRLYGNVGEEVSSSPINSGLFAAALEAKNVLGIYSGHDHLNSFAGKYCGIELGYCASIGYDGYGFGGTFDMNNKLRGGRMIELTLRNGEVTMSSRMVYAADYVIN